LTTELCDRYQRQHPRDTSSDNGDDDVDGQSIFNFIKEDETNDIVQRIINNVQGINTAQELDQPWKQETRKLTTERALEEAVFNWVRIAHAYTEIML
jgi:hypothetical protein